MGKVLVVDDEIDICILLTRHLKKLGHQATYCLTIKDALEEISGGRYDLAFIDLNLTDGSGYDLISSIEERHKPSWIVVISAYDTERQKALDAGANLFVPKPFTNKSIQEALHEIKFLNF